MKIILLLTLLLSTLKLLPQEDANWRYLRPSNTGLPGDFVTTISSDTCGNLWVGAYNIFWEEGGVGEFDGQAWKNWTNFEGHLASKKVRTIYFDKRNHVWIGTDSGIVHYNRDTSWQIWTSANSNLPDDDIYSIVADEQNNIWISINGGINGSGGLAKWDGTSWMVYSSTTSSLPTENIGKIAFDSEGNLWICSKMGLFKYDGLNFIRYHTGNSNILSNSLVDLKFDESGLLWILTSVGLNSFDGTTTWSSYPSLFNVVVQGSTLSSLDVKNGEIAVGVMAGNSGVAHFDGSNWVAYPSSDHLYDVHFDKTGTLWVCGKGFLGKQISGSDWKVFRRYNSGLADYMINDIFIDKQNRKWFASGNGGHSLFDDVVWRTFGLHNNQFEPYPFPTTSIGSATAEDTAGNIWIAVYGTSEGIARWNESLNIFDKIYNSNNTGMWMQSIKTLVIDSANRIWVGTYGNGIYMYNGIQWQLYNAANSKLISDYILQLYVDNQGDVWAGTQNGVYKFGNGGTNIEAFNTSNSGLLNDYVNEIIEQKNGIIWFGTAAGVSKYDGQTWISYTEADGLAGRVVNGLAYDEKNNLLYVGAYEIYNWPYYGGISVYNGSTWTSFLEKNSPIAHKQVEDLELDKFGNLWIMTQTMGVTIYNPNGVVGLEDPNSSCPTFTLNTVINDFKEKINPSILGYPNPVQDIYKLQIELNKKANVSIDIYDISGKIVDNFINQSLYKGQYEYSINFKDFAPGIYLLTVTTDEEKSTIKIIK